MKKIFVLFLLLFFSISYAKSGKEIFDNYCTICHSPAMASMFNAPAAHDINMWNVRKNDAFNRAIVKKSSIKSVTGSEKEEYILNELLTTAINGTVKGMPPKGTCMECTDEELKSVIKFISSVE